MKLLFNLLSSAKSPRKNFAFFAVEDDEKNSAENKSSENADKKEKDPVENTAKETAEKIKRLLKENEELKKEVAELKKNQETKNENTSEKTEGETKSSSDTHNEHRKTQSLDDYEAQKKADDQGRLEEKDKEDKERLKRIKDAKEHLEETSNKINDLEKQHEIIGAGQSGIQNFSTWHQALNEISFRGQAETAETLQALDSYEKGFSEIQEGFKTLKDQPNDIKRKLQHANLRNDLVEHIHRWKFSAEGDSMKEKIGAARQNIKQLFYDLIPDKAAADRFSKKYIEELNLAEKEISKNFENFLKIAQQKKFDFDGTENFWNSFSRTLNKFSRYINLDSGVINDDLAAVKDELENQNKGLTFLDKKGFLKDEKHFQQEFQSVREKVIENTKNYQGKFKKVRRKILQDVDVLNGKEFSDKYGVSKERSADMLQKHEEQLLYFENVRQEWEKPDYFDNWFSKYKESDESRAEALIEAGNWSDYEIGSEKLVEQADNFDLILNPNSQTQTYKFSLYDLYQMFTRFFEKRERLWKRRSERAVARLGMNTFGTETQVGKEFQSEAEKEEHDRVDEFERQKGSSNGWVIQNELYATNDPDEAKACINLLIKLGFMKWDDPKFWRTLNRLEGIDRFKDAMMARTTGFILGQIQEACENIWSKQDFENWKQTIDSSAKSAQDSHKSEFDNYETTDTGIRDEILTGMLKRWKNGEGTNEDVNPARYEGFLKAAFADGKMNGGDAVYDNRIWYLVHGVASGLLSRDALARFNGEELASYPLADFFTDKGAWKKDGKIVPPNTPGAREGGPWSYDDIQAWARQLGNSNGTYEPEKFGETARRRREFFYQNMIGSEFAVDRASRMAKGASKNFDHDDAALYSGVLGTTDIEGMIGTESQMKEQLTKDFWRNYITGFDAFFKEKLIEIDQKDQEYGDLAGWQEQRIQILRNVGEKLRTAIGATQTFLGNYNMSGLATERNTTFNKADWEKESAFSVNALAAKEKINKFAKIFLRNDSQDTSSFESLLESNAIQEGLNEDGRKKRSAIVKKIVKGGTGDKIFTENVDQIYQNLKEYCSE